MISQEKLHKNHTVVFVDEFTRFGQDAIMLAEFADIKRDWKILDLGTGTGIIPLSLYDCGFCGSCVALEISPTAAGLAESSVRHNGFDRMQVINRDFRGYTANYKFDAVLCNPPYFSHGTGKISAKDIVRTARHETECTIADVALTAQKNLKEGGRLTVCYRPERLAELMHELREHKLEPKRMQFAKHSPDSSPWLVFVDARYGGGAGLEILPDRITPKKQLSRAEIKELRGECNGG
ncbi:MAG: methyltransferase [Oscillospiraceae bacterium]